MSIASECRDKEIEVLNYLESSYCEELARDVLRGLTAPKKYIPSRYFYDARGSQLFEEICILPEYYQTRTELPILKNSAPFHNEIIQGRRPCGTGVRCKLEDSNAPRCR